LRKTRTELESSGEMSAEGEISAKRKKSVLMGEPMVAAVVV
jgi:hypothetical protein